jgi:hypothetical protein
MTPKDQILLELETTPLNLITEVLNFLRFLKAKKPQLDFMEFAGMAANIGHLMEEIVIETEINRQLDIDRFLEL